jgi:hypothetical protein
MAIFFPWQNQKQYQDQNQGQFNYQFQGQDQDQDQDQDQGQWQGQYSESVNENGNLNGNGNGNLNGNGNGNLNGNLNDSANTNVNAALNANANLNANLNASVTDVKVKVDIDLDLDEDMLQDNDLIDMKNMDAIENSVVVPEVIYQTVNGAGNNFNIDQINNLTDNDRVEDANVSFANGGAGPLLGLGLLGAGGDAANFEMNANAKGGWSGADDNWSQIGDNGTTGPTGMSSADAAISQEAFTQNIVMGANIQFNSIDLKVAGDDIGDFA